MQFTDPEALFVFDVLDKDGNVVFTLQAQEDFFKVRYPAGMTYAEKMEEAASFPYPIYDGCAYEISQLAVILKAYSPEEFERFLEAYEKAGGQCITRSQTT